MKYWRGYIAAGILIAICAALMAFAAANTVLVDMIYPYFSRLIQTTLAGWTAGMAACLWQVLAIMLVVVFIATVVLMIILKWNFFQWLGWVLASITLLFTLHTGIYGLNSYSSPLADDIRLQVADHPYNTTELAEATTYFRDMANELATQIPRDGAGKPQYPAFEEMAKSATKGYNTLTYDHSLAVFAGSDAPVKELAWADWFTSMGITGFTMPLTGEAAVNPNIPVVSMPFTMCHELAHRLCISYERDANLAAFLACRAHDDVIFQYSGYFMAFRYCFNALASVDTSAAQNAANQIYSGINPQLLADLQDYRAFFDANMDDDATDFANSVNDTYIKVSGDSAGTDSYGQVCDLLVSWHIQEIYLPAHKDEVQQFDPLDKGQVGLGG